MYMEAASFISTYDGSVNEVRKKVISDNEMSYVVMDFLI